MQRATALVIGVLWRIPRTRRQPAAGSATGCGLRACWPREHHPFDPARHPEWDVGVAALPRNSRWIRPRFIERSRTRFFGIGHLPDPNPAAGSRHAIARLDVERLEERVSVQQRYRTRNSGGECGSMVIRRTVSPAGSWRARHA